MKTRTRIAAVAVFITSTTIMNQTLDDAFPIQVTEQATYKPRIGAKAFAFYNKYGESPLAGYIPKRKVHRFIERFFPRTEDEVDSLLRFRKHQKQSAKIKNKRDALVGAPLKVAV